MSFFRKPKDEARSSVPPFIVICGALFYGHTPKVYRTKENSETERSERCLLRVHVLFLRLPNTLRGVSLSSDVARPISVNT